MAINEQVLEETGNGFSISRMTEHDLLEVVEIEEQSGLSRWGWAAYYAELQGSNRDLMLVARAPASTAPRVSHTLAAYIVARIGANELHINNVAVRERYRRQGIGLTLLGRILAEGRRRGIDVAFLELRAGNAAALSLYEKCGFSLTSRRKNYYSDPIEDALVMTIQLGANA
ncbi:MAG TPA: ribosomal protein S18-alanine N-acetyltransferase [Pyrinomonadaceae bacterium]|jgi:ribosomal-protein-alanine N-acetyltransferase|nr:ribosomal protein S18-alanine N-acetyltransferase [Pyrinomonadaceae bacterium]